MAIERKHDSGAQPFVADCARGDLDPQVIVAALFAAPGPEREIVGQRVDSDGPRGQVIDVGRYLLEELDVGALGAPEPQRDVGDLFLHQVGDDSLELGFHLTRAGDDVDGAEERVCNQAEFVDVPVDAQTSAVTLEESDACIDRCPQHLIGLMLILAVG